MKKNFKFLASATKFKVFIFICSLFTFHLSLFTASHAKVYIDITSPAFRKLPITITSTGHNKAKEVERIVKNDLYFTGIFFNVDPDVPGAEIRVNIEVEVSDSLKTTVIVSDLIENRKVLTKEYKASGKIIRALSHSISNDIFRVVTGKKGIFRTKLAYIVDSSGRKKLHLMDWDGYNSLRLVSKGRTLSHSWSYDGQYIVYSSERNRMWKIYLLNLGNYRETVLFSSKGLNLVGGVSPGGRIAFSSSKDGSPEIYVININGSGSKKLTKSLGIDVSPVFSPDGSRIAFVSDRGGAPQIYVMDADGRGIRRITFEGNYNTSPAWSQDGKWIAFVGRKNGKNQIFMIKSDATGLRQLTDRGNNESPAFSPDGLFIAFDSDRDGRRGIYIMRVNGEGQKRITPKSIKAMAPQWSPYFK